MSQHFCILIFQIKAIKRIRFMYEKTHILRVLKQLIRFLSTLSQTSFHSNQVLIVQFSFLFIHFY